MLRIDQKCRASPRRALESKAASIFTGAVRWAFHHFAANTRRTLLTEQEIEMAMRQAMISITGINPLLQNNPQTVDPFNRYTKAKKAITNKRTAKTDDDLIELGNLETESKLYFDDKLGVFVPATWITEAICTTAFAVAKIGRAKMRGGIFATENKIKLNYRSSSKVKTIKDVVMNPDFRHRMLLKQGQVRVPKDAPIFHDWAFSTVIEFDDAVIDLSTLTRVVKHAARYGGFGDFRPTFGRATAEVENV